MVRSGQARLGALRDLVLKDSRVRLEQPIFIWGAPRSGTHLLYDILSLHPALVCPRTTVRRKKGLWGSMHWGDSTPAALKGRPAPYEGLERCWFEAGVRFDAVGLFGSERLTPETLAAVQRRYLDLGREWRWAAPSRYRILDKSPTYLLMVDAIEAVLPGALHVFCIRDPRAVLNSLLRVYRFPEGGGGRGQIDELGFATGVPPGHEAHRHESVVRRLSWQVGALQDLGFSLAPRLGDRLVEFRYEWLLTDAHSSSERLMQRLALAPLPELRRLIPNTFPDYAPAWPRPGETPAEPYGKQRCYTDDEVGELAEVEAQAVRLGYAPHVVGRLATAP